jgi:hypothetical protein
MKIFKANDGQIFQLAEKKRIQQWDAEMPILFYNYIKEKRIPIYPKEVRVEVESYMNDILTTIAIPKLITELKNPNVLAKRSAAKNLLDLSKRTQNLLKSYLSNIDSIAKTETDPDTSTRIKETLKNLQKP